MASKATARQRAEAILQVRSGQMTATAAAASLGVSRKTYYEWEARGLSAMLQQLEDQEPGRPPEAANPQELALQAKVAALEKQVESLAQTAEIRAMLRMMEQGPTKKKRKPSRKSSP